MEDIIELPWSYRNFCLLNKTFTSTNFLNEIMIFIVFVWRILIFLELNTIIYISISRTYDPRLTFCSPLMINKSENIKPTLNIKIYREHYLLNISHIPDIVPSALNGLCHLFLTMAMGAIQFTGGKTDTQWGKEFVKSQPLESSKIKI